MIQRDPDLRLDFSPVKEDKRIEKFKKLLVNTFDENSNFKETNIINEIAAK